jgi:hypothetical protein
MEIEAQWGEPIALVVGQRIGLVHAGAGDSVFSRHLRDHGSHTNLGLSQALCLRKRVDNQPEGIRRSKGHMPAEVEGGANAVRANYRLPRQTKLGRIRCGRAEPRRPVPLMHRVCHVMNGAE